MYRLEFLPFESVLGAFKNNSYWWHWANPYTIFSYAVNEVDIFSGIYVLKF